MPPTSRAISGHQSAKRYWKRHHAARDVNAGGQRSFTTGVTTSRCCLGRSLKRLLRSADRVTKTSNSTLKGKSPQGGLTSDSQRFKKNIGIYTFLGTLFADAEKRRQVNSFAVSSGAESGRARPGPCTTVPRREDGVFPDVPVVKVTTNGPRLRVGLVGVRQGRQCQSDLLGQATGSAEGRVFRHEPILLRGRSALWV